MMNKLKSARAHLLKFLFVLPVLAVTLLAFRSQQQLNKQKAYLQSKDLVRDTVPPKPPQPPVVVDVNLDKIARPAPPPPPPIPRAVKSIYMDATTNKATVVLKNGKKEVYNLTDPSQRAIYDTKYSLHPVPAPPPPPVVEPNTTDVYFIDSTGNKQKMKMYRDKNNFYKTQEDMYRDKEKKYKDQEQQYKTKEDQYKTKEDQYEKKEDEYRKKEELYKNKEKVYNDKEAMYITADTVTVPAGTYALKGSLGVLPKTKDDIVKPHADTYSLKSLLVVGYKTGSRDTAPPMYIINGVISSILDFSNISPQQIESITILKGEDATRLYGEKATHGVVVVRTKGGRVTGDTGNVSFRVMEDINSLNHYKGLVVINGKEASGADVEKMLAAFRKDPFTVTLDMKMLRKEEALRTWGDKGKAGVMMVSFQQKNL